MTMTTIETLLTDLIPLLIPLAIALASWCYQSLMQRLPEKQRQTADHLAHLAVAKVEQVYEGVAPADKKQLATKFVGDMLAAFHLPVNAVLIDTAIEAAVFEINQGKPTDPLGPDPLARDAPHG